MDAHNFEKNAIILVALVLVAGIAYFTNSEDLSGITGNVATVRDSCPAERIVYKLSSSSNAHAEKPIGVTNPNLNYLSMCNDDALDRLCNGNNVLFRISSDTNAHVETSLRSTAEYEDLCVGGNIPRFECVTFNSRGQTCEELFIGSDCFGSISSNTNAHIGDCNAYDLKICCGVGVPTSDICVITETKWYLNPEGTQEIPANVVEDGTQVYAVVKGTSACRNRNLEVFDLNRINSFTGEEDWTSDGTFDSNAIITRSWTADRKCVLGCIFGDPKYEFITEILGNRRTSSPLTVVVDLGGCTNNEECPVAGEICDVPSGICVEGCTDNNQCSGQICNVQTGMCEPCIDNNQCGGLICDIPSGICVECINNDQCSGQICNVQTNMCVNECTDNSQCTNGVCDIPLGVCVECIDDNDCPLGEECFAGQCIPGGPGPEVDCGNGIIDVLKGEICDVRAIEGADDVLPGGVNDCNAHSTWIGGLLTCSENCRNIDTSNCILN